MKRKDIVRGTIYTMLTSENKRKICAFSSVGISLCASILMVVVVWFRAGICFETNDDRYISEILSGTYGGQPEAHTVFVNYLLSLLLVFLYKATIRVSWYGYMLLALQILSYALMFNSVLYICKRKIHILFGMGAVVALFLQNFYSAAKIQFTSTAILLTVAGYIYLLLHQDEKRRGVLVFAFSMLCACMLRRDAMLMIQPLGIAAAAGLLLIDKKKNFRSKAVVFLNILGIIAGCIVLGELGNAIGYHSTEWKEYIRYNNARAEIFDYYGKPDYEEIADILAEYNVSRTEYEAYREYIIVGGNLNADCAEKIALYAQSKYEFPTFGELIASYKNMMWDKYAWGVNKITVDVMFIALVLMVLYGQYRFLLPVALIKAGACAVWGYLLYRGRMPNRVILPLYVGETAMYLVIILLVVVHTEKKKVWKGICALVAGVVFFAMCFQTGRQQYRFLQPQNVGMKLYMQGMWEINDYCNRHPERKYLLDSFSVSYYSGNVSDNKFNGPHNNLVLGTWYSYSPVMQETIKKYLADADKGVYLIMYDFGNGETNPTIVYLQEKTNAEAVLVDEFYASHGGRYLIYYFDGELIL